MRTITRALGLFVALAVLAPLVARADVSYERLLRAESEPQNWLTYSGSYASQRYSALREIKPSNAANLELQWVFQAQSLESFETTPLVVDGVMYLTEAPDTRRRARCRDRPDLLALSAQSGRERAAVLRTREPRGRDSRRARSSWRRSTAS